jgi:hypothetical protein
MLTTEIKIVFSFRVRTDAGDHAARNGRHSLSIVRWVPVGRPNRYASPEHRPKTSGGGGDNSCVSRHRQRRQRHLFGRFLPVLKNRQVARTQNQFPSIQRKRAGIGRADGEQSGSRIIGGEPLENRNFSLRPRFGWIDEERFSSRRDSLEVGFEIISAPVNFAVAFVFRVILHQDALRRLGKGEDRVWRRHDIIPLTPERPGHASATAEATSGRQQIQNSSSHKCPKSCWTNHASPPSRRQLKSRLCRTGLTLRFEPGPTASIIPL